MSSAPRPDRPDGTSSYRAGVQGGQLIYERLNALSDAREAAGWREQVKYLAGVKRGGALAREEFGADRMRAWTRTRSEGGAVPKPENQARIATLYRSVHRDNMRSYLKGQLNKGVMVEVTPASDVDAQSAHQIPIIEFELDDWNVFVDAWADEDLDTMYDEWDDVAEDNLYDGGAYAYVASIGF
jgi:hypothetical protein